MVGEGTTAILITFLLAMIGYGGLTAVILLSAPPDDIISRLIGNGNTN